MATAAPRTRRFPWWMAPIVWPCRLLWWMATRAERRMGILLTLLIGVAFLLIGLYLTSTIIGAIPGLPMVVLGGFLTMRALY